MIYLDNSATTKPKEEVVQSFQQAALQYFGNSSSIHGLGMDAERLLRMSREQAASILQVDSREIIFTSGGTEGNNVAIKGVALEHQNRGKHIITTQIEHPSVLETCRSLEKHGFEISYLPVDQDGRVCVEDLRASLREDTILVSIMHVNNEIGTIQPIERFGEVLKKYPKALFHVDHVQGFGKVPLNIKQSGIDLLTISGHKIHGLKGTGLLYVKGGTKLFSLHHGGGQEANLRSGTENLPGIVALVKAMRLVNNDREQHLNHLERLKMFLYKKISNLESCVLNTPEENSAPHIIHFSVPGLKPEVVIHALEEAEIYISTKSACSSKSADESAVLVACGKANNISTSGLRVSLSYETTQQELDFFVEKLQEVLEKLSKVMR
ncbi:cysteine desulfurase family protein [Gracilibacillus dipsosauri]|uniref:Cysteine desulfurase NifS n=1 Tax=Gracilibacillus dipsosauri TaxID=178340 RepID=A0A317L3Z9_9BACI|nr:cysteine desulfurase family protein [Gracilibacillus dipsosauri]PWU70223.1 cysteine desulfurase NifS [Gracilibacillus dipsosauri]